MTAIGFVTLMVGVAAVGEDLARRRISNWTSGAALVSGFAVHGVQQGWHGAVTAAAGAAAGFAVFAVFYLLNGLGAGDVKLMAGFGSLLGPATILCAAWIAAVAGGLMAVASAVILTVRQRSSSGRVTAGADAIPYAPAIVAGVWLAEIARG
jgi:prepilin peptidase CpaA